MKHEHKIKLADKELTLSLTFKTSMVIADKIGSPSQIVSDIVQREECRRKGRPYHGQFVLDERLAVRVIEIGNADYEGLSFDEIGELAFKAGFITAFAHVVDYLTSMVTPPEDMPEMDTEADSDGEPGNRGWADFVKSAYLAARDWGLTWQEFQVLPIPLWWYELGDRLKVQQKRQEIMDDHTPGFGGFTQGDWKRARKAHQEKMKNG